MLKEVGKYKTLYDKDDANDDAIDQSQRLVLQ